MDTTRKTKSSRDRGGFPVYVKTLVGSVVEGESDHGPTEAAFLLIAGQGDGQFTFKPDADGPEVSVTVAYGDEA